MEGPAQTLNYMIAGYAVIFGVMGGYVISLIVRWQRLRKEQAYLEELNSGEE